MQKAPAAYGGVAADILLCTLRFQSAATNPCGRSSPTIISST